MSSPLIPQEYDDIWSVKIPGKTLLVGEYLALQTGEALVLSHEPFYTFSCSKKPFSNSVLLKDLFHSQSPAGRWIASQNLLENGFWARFDQPYQQGGFGTSSAEFLALWIFTQSQTGHQKEVVEALKTGAGLKRLFEDYQNSLLVPEGARRPSGVDLLAQTQTGLCYVCSKGNLEVEPMEWPFENLEIQIEPSGLKVNTHDHLSSLGNHDFGDLKIIFKRVRDSLFSKDSDVFLAAVSDYRQNLFGRGLEHPQTTEKRKVFKTSTGEVFKGCGAWGADVYLRVLRKSLKAQWEKSERWEDMSSPRQDQFCIGYPVKQKNPVFLEVSAPPNIALIKYMGKVDAQTNLPTNPSLSWSMEKYRTTVRIQKIESSSENPGADQWSSHPDFPRLEMSEKGKEKYLRHFSRLKEKLSLQGQYLIQSGNNFASDAGLASSASSFAALTLAAVSESERRGGKSCSLEVMSSWSREGSGSSCRSFFSPWAEWDREGARPVETVWNDLFHRIILVSSSKKEVSSSEAHLRVLDSPRFQGRVERATTRFQRLKVLLQTRSSENWREMFDLVWEEFQDMHLLFETCPEPFSYRNEKVFKILEGLRKHWDLHKDGPLVTMDAGPNIHLLFRADQYGLALEWEKKGLYQGALV